MGSLVRILLAVFSLGLAVLYKNYGDMKTLISAPKFDFNEYWGPGNAANYKEDTAVRTFDIAVKPQLIEELKSQLSRPLKFQEPLEGVGFEYGFNSKEITNAIKYWRDTYLAKWNERETFLKQFPHFQTQIQSLNSHFIHVQPQKAAGKKVLPCYCCTAGPVQLLTLLIPNAKSDYVFEVVVPSLPGYGWSQGAAKKNFGPAQMSIVLRNLMLRLGHNKFVFQGGDWGSILGSNMAALFPDNVLGYHSNMCGSMSPVSNIKLLMQTLLPSVFLEKEHIEFHKGIPDLFIHIMEKFGYLDIQATKPDTIGAVLSNHPVGLAIYILEKFSTWTNIEYRKLENGGLTKRYTWEALFDNVMIYYVTDSITTSQRLYAEGFSKAQMGLEMDRVGVKVPSGCARFKHDLAHQSDWLLKDKFVNLVHSTYYTDGGHFVAMELPKVLYEDFMQFVKKADQNW